MTFGPVLAFDTSAAHCAAALLRPDGTVTDRVEPMDRGQAERLFPLLEQILAEAGIGWGNLAALGVCTGPGNFTGVRIAVSAARGLALSLGVPAVGVTLFEAVEAGGEAPAALISLSAPRGLAYVQHFHDRRPDAPPRLIDPASPPDGLGLAPGALVRGHRATEIARHFGTPHFNIRAEETEPAGIAPRIARITRDRLLAGETPPRPAPLYVRPADAAPPSEAPPVILPAILPG
ncbi:MAG: tRNA (adenosine(37)-N6)-threonylcarbamoyltransferase complex dimerization subunit type 1 TsaB [Gemmobacter sp.]